MRDHRKTGVNAGAWPSRACLPGVCRLLAGVLLAGVLVAGGVLTVARAAAAAQPRDPSYSVIAQRWAALLHLALLAGATFTPDDLITDANFTAADALERV